MTSINDSKLWLGIIFTSIFIALGYEFKDFLVIQDTLSLKIVGFAVSILLSGIFTNFFVDSALSFKKGRQFIMRDGWIEGYWEWKSFNNDDTDSIKPGIMYLSYVGKNHELRAVVYRTKDDGVAQYTHTEFASLRDYDGRYFNYATLPKGDSETKAYAIGRFFKTKTSNHPNVYEGTVIVEGKVKNQAGKKILDKVIDQYIANHQDNWMAKYIEDNFKK